MIRVVAAVVIEKGRVLLASRPTDKPPAGWEFPGGKIEPGETPGAALIRELREELAWNVVPADQIYLLRKPGIILYFLRAHAVGGSEPVPCEHQRCAWVDLAPEPPPKLLKNDLEFWKFIAG